MDRRTYLAGAMAASILGVNPVTADEHTAVVGERIEGEPLELVIENADTTSTLDEFTEADEGNQFVVVGIAYKNTSDEFHTVSGWLQSRIRDGEGYTYDQSFFSTGQVLNDGQIAPGEVERGDVVYEVPEDATGLVLEFDFELELFGEVEQATIDLEGEADDPYVLEQDLQVDIHDVGDSVEHGGTTVTVNEFETATELDEFTQADTDHEYVIVDITVGNATDEEQQASTMLQMQLKDGEGFSYGSAIGATTALDREFDDLAPISSGEERRGQLAYEVEAGHEPLYWVFEFALFDEGDKTFWRLR